MLGTFVLATAAVACSGSTGGGQAEGGEPAPDLGFEPAPAGPSWAPRPETEGGLSAVAGVEGERFVLHTEHGEVDFLPGINLGSTTPGHQPGELAITAEDVRRWLPQMAAVGFRVIRIYTILPPQFYDELAAYNAEHEDAPLYLVQGVYLPDESYVEGGDLYAPAVTTTFTEEIRDAAGAVHGDLTRAPTPGRADGTWTTDVSPWVISWIIGAELDPTATAASDARNVDQPLHVGRYFTNTESASPTTRWLAARMDEMAAADAEHGHAAPIAFVNWPTLDPLTHPEEPNDLEDLVGIDANAVVATAAWPAGTFASYHAYPYYPDFLRHEPGLQVERNGEVDPYFGYLEALKRHHEGMPVMITEFGVPSSLGSAHNGALGRDQGDHSEQEALEIDAELLQIIRDVDLAGAFVFSWTDEWFKLTWNTQPRQIPANRRQLWHDVLTNEQYFGLVATDAVGGEDARLRVIAEEPEMTVRVGTDESYVHLEVELAEEPEAPVALAFDVVDGGPELLPDSTATGAEPDYAVVIDPAAEDGLAWVRADLDPVQLDNVPPPDPRPAPVNGWVPQHMMLNRAQVVPSTGERLPAEHFEVGVLRQGEMAPDADGYDSRNTWQLDGRTLTLRIPWGLLGMADPSSKQALLPEDGAATTVDVDRIGLTVDVGELRVETDGIAWEPWNEPRSEERMKVGMQVFVDALDAVTPR